MKRKILNAMNKNKWMYAIIILSSIMYSVLNMINPILSAKLIDNLIKIKNINNIYYLIGIIAFVVILQNICMYFKDINKTKQENKLKYEIESDLISQCLKSDFLSISNFNSVYLAERISEDSYKTSNFIVSNLAEIVVNFLMFILGILVLINIHPMFSLISIISIPIYLLLLFKMKNKIYLANIKSRECNAKYKSTLEEQLKLSLLIKYQNLYNKSSERLKVSFSPLYKWVVKIFNYMYVFYSIDGYLTFIVQIIFFIYGAHLLQYRKITIGEFTIVLSYYTILIGSVRYFLNLAREFEGFKASMDRLNEILNLPKELNGSLNISNINTLVTTNLQFSYDSKTNITFPNININKNGVYLFKGSNGKGKSTLINLLSGIYKPTSGQLLINNVKFENIDQYLLRTKLISYVRQNPLFVDATVEENVNTILNSNLDYSSFIKKIKSINLLGFFNAGKSLSSKEWSNNINNLSMGQKKKIEILLALLQQKQLLIMDEPTASLDAASSCLIVDYIEHFCCENIVILISHDEYFNKISSKIYSFS